MLCVLMLLTFSQVRIELGKKTLQCDSYLRNLLSQQIHDDDYVFLHILFGLNRVVFILREEDKEFLTEPIRELVCGGLQLCLAEIAVTIWESGFIQSLESVFSLNIHYIAEESK